MPMVLTRRVLVGAASAAVLAAARGARAQGGATEIRVAMSSFSFGTAALRIADQAGLFAKAGLKPRFTVMDSGNAATSALIGGSVEFSVAGPGEVLTARSRGQDVVVVANGYRGLAATLVLQKALADMAGGVGLPVAQRQKALDGLIVAAPSATSAYVAPFRDSAAAAGAKLRLTYMAQPAMPAALGAGAVQAFVAAAPFWGEAVLKGFGVPWISGPHGDLADQFVPASTACIQTTGARAKANPALMRAMGAVMMDLAALIRDRRAEAKAALGRAYAQLSPEALDLAFEAEAVAWTHPRLSEADIRHEIGLLKATGVNLAGLDAIQPAEVLQFQAAG